LLFMRLRQLAPNLFAGPPVPLMCGIYAELVQRLGLDDEQDLAALRAILRKTVNRPAYQMALAAEGAWRRGLAGEPVEPVSETHRARAQSALEALKRKAQIKGNGAR
jgi:sRNA-binding protein